MEFGKLLWLLSGLKVGVNVRLGERFLIVQSRWLVEVRGGGVSHIVGISFIFALRGRFFLSFIIFLWFGGNVLVCLLHISLSMWRFPRSFVPFRPMYPPMFFR